MRSIDGARYIPLHVRQASQMSCRVREDRQDGREFHLVYVVVSCALARGRNNKDNGNVYEVSGWCVWEGGCPREISGKTPS